MAPKMLKRPKNGLPTCRKRGLKRPMTDGRLFNFRERPVKRLSTGRALEARDQLSDITVGQVTLSLLPWSPQDKLMPHTYPEYHDTRSETDAPHIHSVGARDMFLGVYFGKPARV
ncbi:hypothetical protein CC1G_15134 [Coprinopsis cinerea okayama7|uniref:Uncharacterized protein n=1 Tax=Coprinopsis cinerea (strain Okayama-7 / 130 / ATCC MYA-4618 / FGSC 9003) TaxID=240176 RepID=D6RPP0_COPC7|nr:hypothetical protein CC1G_15134 [Coprinopsis cinerea okayama7\|eukprot:XP_002910497.1 hypothetical protein CC1G_15134 [Coprinopsis cinerea okayama7\